MPKIECTAVNELIDLVQQRPMTRDDAEEEVLFSAPRQVRLRGTEPPPRIDLFAVSLPPLPVAQPAAPQPQPIAQPAPLPYSPPIPQPVAQPPAYAANAYAHAPLELDASQSIDRATMLVPRSAPIGRLAKRIALPAAAIAGLALGCGIVYAVASSGDTGPSVSDVTFAAANAVPPAPRPVAPPPAPTPAAAAPTPVLVQVRLDSTPPGATATLLSNGSSTPLGATPVVASVDPAKKYDVVFAVDGQPSKVAHLDPSSMQHLEVAFDAPAPAAAAPAPTPAVVAKAPHHHHRDHHAASAAVARVAAAPPSRQKSPSAAVVPDPGAGNGTLSIVTDAPCAILIDDHNTGLTSPQRAIPVPAGHHNVRLIAAALHVNKLFSVDAAVHKVTRISATFQK